MFDPVQFGAGFVIKRLGQAELSHPLAFLRLALAQFAETFLRSGHFAILLKCSSRLISHGTA